MPSHTELMPLRRQTKTFIFFRTARLHIQRYSFLFSVTGAERTPDSKEGILHLLSALRTGFCGKLQASLTVEAALVLPLYVVSICFLMMPLVIMNAQARAQYQMEKAAELESGRACLQSLFSSAGKEADSTKLTNYLGSSPQAAATFASVASGYPKQLLGTPTPVCWKMADSADPMIRLQITSKTRFPLSSFLGNDWGRIGLVASRRAWVGRKGGEGRAYAERKDEKTEEERIVYVARNASRSSRYHISAACHYIDNRLTAVSGSEIDSMRAADGSRYRACSSCRPSVQGTVYLFPSSNIYHADTRCKAIQSFTVEMKESEAKKRGYSPCSYCGKN